MATLRPATPEELKAIKLREHERTSLMEMIRRRAKERGIKIVERPPQMGMTEDPPYRPAKPKAED